MRNSISYFPTQVNRNTQAARVGYNEEFHISSKPIFSINKSSRALSPYIIHTSWCTFTISLSRRVWPTFMIVINED
jgi:hypothetical protein